MFNQIFASSNLPVLQEVVHFAQARHELLAGNVANVSTPGYQSRDLSLEVFQDRLQEAIHAKTQKHEPLSPGLSKVKAGDKMRRVREATESILYHDGSNVGMEQQVAELTKNQLMHNLAISLLQNQFNRLQMAIRERVTV